MTTQITPENVGFRPYTAEEYVARKLDQFGGYDMSADPNLRGVTINYSRIWDYQIAINGQNPDELRKDILEKVVGLNAIQAAQIDRDFSWA